MYIETIIDIHKKFLALVQDAFGGEQGFTAALDKVNRSSLLKDFIINLLHRFRRVVNLSIITLSLKQLVVQPNHRNY